MRGEYVLVVDDEPIARDMLATQVTYLGHECETASDGNEALQVASRETPPAVILSDVRMPGLDGVGLLTKIKSLDDKIQVVMVSGSQDIDTVRECLRGGAYDYLLKPFDVESLSKTVDQAIERHRLLHQNEVYRRTLERMIREQQQRLAETRDIALITLAKLAESRDNETGHHLERIAAYSRRVATALRSDTHTTRLDDAFVEQIFRSSPLHDIGKVGIPDSILLKPGPLTIEERKIMNTHTTIGGETLRSVIERYEAHSFLVMGMEIAFSHHEHWDGLGYPKGLKGEAIPLSARIVALVDAYDAITTKRPYKKPFDHAEALRRIERDRGKHFDPAVVDAFMSCHEDFDSTRKQFSDPTPSATAEVGSGHSRFPPS